MSKLVAIYSADCTSIEQANTF